MRNIYRAFNIRHALAGTILLICFQVVGTGVGIFTVDQAIHLGLWLAGAVIAFSFGLSPYQHGVKAMLVALIIGLVLNLSYSTVVVTGILR
ncbi:hypothetical protein ACKF11_13570 [Methylobacillus sp. Pita2]|uniref:hypothetical protein n=1 Tax=Methylobacillus sp. Pita2 TaxID=3383245 RepID=UPI0038B43C55